MGLSTYRNTGQSVWGQRVNGFMVRYMSDEDQSRRRRNNQKEGRRSDLVGRKTGVNLLPTSELGR